MAWLCLSIGHSVTVFGQEAVFCHQAHGRIFFPGIAYGQVEIQQGDLYQQRVPFEAPPNAQVFHLGKGIVGGDVYRVVSENGSSKIYKDSKMAQSDITRFETIRQAIQNPRWDSADRFQVPKARLISENIAEMSDTHGTNLKRVLLSDSTPKKLKIMLEKKYRACLGDLFQELKKRFPLARLHSDGVLTIGSDDMDFSAQTLFLHKENIVVTPTYDLVIIDPY